MGRTLTLSPEQLKPVYSDSQLNLCLAVPGSGKTSVLTERVRRLRKKGRTLSLTFSRKAAQEIERRLEGQDTHCKVQTIHGWCLSVVREEWQTLGRIVGSRSWPAEPEVISGKEELSVIRQLLPERDPRKAHASIVSLRELGISPEQALQLMSQGHFLGGARERDVLDWATYELGRLRLGLLIFEDMAPLAETILTMPGTAVKACRWDHVCLDEAQDTSGVQWRAIRPLLLSTETTLVVGDSNQRIYGWRGADGAVMKHLGERPDTVVFRLSRSFRSLGAIAKLANALVGDRASFIETPLEGGRVVVGGYETREAEVEAVLAEAGPGSAILSRTNGYLEMFERQLIAGAVPYTGAAFYRSDHIESLAAFFRRGGQMDLVPQAFLENERYGFAERADIRLALQIAEERGVDSFLSLVQDSGDAKSGVVLATGHSAKGLEWDRVFVVGCHPGHVPHRLSHDSKEETNLLYVMASRARVECHVSYVGEPSSLLVEAGLA